MNKTWGVLFLILIMTGFCPAAEFHFASIEKLIEQEVGRIILPQIYKKLGIEIKITPMPGKRAQEQAASGKKDGEIMRIFTYGIENPTTIRVPTPYYYLETMAFVVKGRGVQIDSKEDLRKYRLVKVRGVKHTNNITAGMIHVTDLDTTKQIMKFMQADRADAALTNTVDGNLILQQIRLTDLIKPIHKPLAVLKLYHYIHEDQKHLVSKVDTVIREMQDSGELQTLIEKAEKHIIGL